LVTIGHAIQAFAYTDQSFLEDWAFQAIYMFHMPLFMGLSGSASYRSLQGCALRPFVFGKLRAYLLPIVVWAITYQLALFAIKAAISPSAPSLGALPGSLASEAIYRLWFLWVLLGCLTITAGLKQWDKAFKYTFPLSTFAILALPEVYNLNLLKFTYPFFQVGYLLASPDSPRLPDRARPLLLWASLPVAVACYILWEPSTYIYDSGMTLTEANSWNIALRLCAAASLSPLMIALLRWTHGQAPLKVRLMIEGFGAASLAIYIFQSYSIWLLGRALQQAAHYTSLPPRMTTVGSIALGVILCIVYWQGTRLITWSPWLSTLLLGKAKTQATSRRA